MTLPGSPLWTFSLRVYARPGAEPACLALQESCGADVNLLLFCCWLGATRRRATPALLRRAMADVSAWRRAAVLPLRRTRRSLAAGAPAVPARWTAPVRKAVLAAELRAEQVEQLLLAPHARRAPRSTRACAEANLAGYLALLRGGRAAARHVAALARCVDSGSDP